MAKLQKGCIIPKSLNSDSKKTYKDVSFSDFICILAIPVIKDLFDCLLN